MAGGDLYRSLEAIVGSREIHHRGAAQANIAHRSSGVAYTPDQAVVNLIRGDSAVAAHQHLVGTQQGSTGLEAIEAEPELRDSFKELKQYSDNVTSFMDLEVGRIDAVVVAQTTAAYFIKKNNAPFRIIDVGYPDIPSGVGMRKDDTELKARIDKVLEDMHNDGTSKKISEKWFGIDVTM